MTSTTTIPVSDDEAIRLVFQQYAQGAISGRSADLQSVFHADAVIHGYIGEDPFGGPIQMFFDWHDENGAAERVTMQIGSIDIEGSIATARVELDDWTGHRFTDMFTLLKADGQWKIISKVFYLHP